MAQITATDINNSALNIAQRNAERHRVKNITFDKGDWFAAARNRTYDLIVSNPPYIAVNDPHLEQGDLRFEPESALVSGTEGLDDLSSIITDAKNYLNDEGWLLVEHGYQQGAAVRKLFNDCDFNSFSTVTDYAGLERASLGQA